MLLLLLLLLLLFFCEKNLVFGFWLKPSWLVVSWNYAFSCFKLVELFIAITPSVIKTDCGTSFLKRFVLQSAFCYKEIMYSIVDLMKSLLAFSTVGPISVCSCFYWNSPYKRLHRCLSREDLITNFKWESSTLLFFSKQSCTSLCQYFFVKVALKTVSVDDYLEKIWS